jgi:cobalamin biosynthesis Mg chelatase CobN
MSQPALNSANSAAAPEVATERAANDLGPSFYTGAANAARSAPDIDASLSLGEVAVQNKARNGAQHARSYTNADVQNLISRRGVGNIMEAANRAPSGVPPAQDTQVATSAPASQQNANSGGTVTSSNQNVSQPAQNSSGVPAAEAANTGAGQPAANQTQQNTQSNAGNSGTTPQIRQAQPADTRENAQQLPATSTILPLLGLIGLATSGAGLWYRRRICN